MTIITEFNYGQSTAQFAEYTSLLFGIAKAGDGKTDVHGRINAVQRMTDAFMECRGTRPDSTQLDRLASLILRDELTDKHPDKMTREEYSILSDKQAKRRRRSEILTDFDDEKDDESRDYHSALTSHIASDGRSYRKPIRRTRSLYELMRMDAEKRR